MPCLLAWRQREVVLTRPRCSPDSLMYGALFFTVVLLVIIAYFLTGGLPLLVLKHDVPLPPMHRFQSRLCHRGL